MKIVNKTHWRTSHLRDFIRRVALSEIEAPARKALHVVVKYNHQKGQGSCSGRASLARPVITIMVPSQVVDRVDLAHTIAHELAHTRGMQHRQMNRNPQYCRIGDWRQRYAWAEMMPLERSMPKAKPKADAQMQRYQRALASEKRWLTKLKRAQTALAKLRSKLRYYERVLTAAGKLPKTDGEQ